MTPDGGHLSSKATGQGRRVHTKWQLLKAVEDIREPLGLKGTTIAVLRAALSYIRSDDISDARHETHVCFASNASLAERAHVSVQTVERHIAKLVSYGLIDRVQSGNGKRWARRDSLGRIVFATGLSVLPLLRRHEEFQTLAKQHEATQLKLVLLRDECAVRLAELVDSADETAEIIAIKARGRNILRRKPDSDALKCLLSEIIEELSNTQGNSAKELRDQDHHIEGHKETPLTPSVPQKEMPPIQVTQQDMEQYFPKLCLELRCARSQQACEHQMDELAEYIGLGSLWYEIKSLGAARKFMILGYLLERIDSIQSPRAYAWKLCNDLKDGTVEWQTLLRRPQRAPHRALADAGDLTHDERYGLAS